MERIELARQVAERVAGSVRAIERMAYGHACETFSALTDRARWIIKTTAEPGAFDHTAKHFKLLSSLGVPVPSRIQIGSVDRLHYLVYEALPGRDLGHELGTMTRLQMSVLAEQIVEMQRRVTGLPPGRGFGWTPIDVPGPFKTWLEVVERDSKSSPDEVKALIRGTSNHFAEQPAICFLDDITVKNVIVLDGGLSGIVDVDFFCYGDPMYWLSLTETTVVLDVGFEAAFYCEELRRHWNLSKGEIRALRIYRAIHSSYFLARPDLTPEQRVRMERFYADNVSKPGA